MTGLLIVGLVLSFLPFLVSLAGRGIWKFLSFLCCLLAAVGAVPTFGLSILCWIAGWVFAGVAISNRRREERFDRLEKALSSQRSPSPSATVATSPVEMLLANTAEPTKRGIAGPLLIRSFLAVAIVFFVGALVIKKDEVNSLMVSAEQPVPIEPPKVTPTLFVATVDNEPNWRADSVPTAWPKFTVVPNEKPLPSKTDVQKLALANDILNRWQSYKDGKTKQRPTTKESGQAITYLLTIDPKSSAFPTAWSSFIQLRKVDREISRVERP